VEKLGSGIDAVWQIYAVKFSEVFLDFSQFGLCTIFGDVSVQPLILWNSLRENGNR
jgi:hypothetical protein